MSLGSSPSRVESALDLLERRVELSARRDEVAAELRRVDRELEEVERGCAASREGLSVDDLLAAVGDLVAENRRLKEALRSAEVGEAVPSTTAVRTTVSDLPSAADGERSDQAAVAVEPSAEASSDVVVASDPSVEKPKRGYYADKQFRVGYKQGHTDKKAGVAFEPGRGRGNVYRGYAAGYLDAERKVDDWEAAFNRLLEERNGKAGHAPEDDEIGAVLSDDGRVPGLGFAPSASPVSASGRDAAPAEAPLELSEVGVADFPSGGEAPEGLPADDLPSDRLPTDDVPADGRDSSRIDESVLDAEPGLEPELSGGDPFRFHDTVAAGAVAEGGNGRSEGSSPESSFQGTAARTPLPELWDETADGAAVAGDDEGHGRLRGESPF